MTALAASLFAFAALASGWAIAATLRRYGSAVRALRARRVACPDGLVINWKQVERTPLPPLFALRTAPPRRLVMPALEWPHTVRLAGPVSRAA